MPVEASQNETCPECGLAPTSRRHNNIFDCFSELKRAYERAIIRLDTYEPGCASTLKNRLASELRAAAEAARAI